MKIMKDKIKSMLAVALVGASVSSCSLDMLPLDLVVLENYWTNKSDVESVVSSCYNGLQEGGYIKNMIVWGESRSDNVSAGTDADDNLKNLLKGSLRSTNPYCDWGGLYNVINRCNTVLYYAPQVAEEDPNYTTSDLRITQAECKALRAISYLTLIKTFKDVPFSFEPSIDDNANYRLPATKFEVILDSLIQDIEECKDYAPRKYSTALYNTGKITRAAMYALLAELYLWRASDYQLSMAQQNEYYRKCIAACDWVLDFKIEQYNSNDFMGPNGMVDLTRVVDQTVRATYGYPLLAEVSQGGGTVPAATNSIFGTGNSYESIFEITFEKTSAEGYAKNADILYGFYPAKNDPMKQWLVFNDNIQAKAPTTTDVTYLDNGDLFSTATDVRWANFNYPTTGGSSTIQIFKCMASSVMLDYSAITAPIDYTKPLSYSYPSDYNAQYRNWIIYRMTEIMLFRAEAEIELAGNMNKEAAAGEEETGDEEEAEKAETKARRAAVSGSSLQTAEELYDDAFNLILAVYVRSNPYSARTASARPSRANYTTLEAMENLLMRERQREFLFEGKRYYDLVRQARRDGHTKRLQEAIIGKFGEAPKAVIIKMAMMDFMYMPIAKRQLQVNPNLKQNPAYADEENIVIN